MAARTIAVKITVENRTAVTAITQQKKAQDDLGASTKGLEGSIKSLEQSLISVATGKQKLWHVTEGLTNSFIKGNLAARAISMGFNAVKDSLGYVIGESLNLSLTMARVSAVTGMSTSETAALTDQVFKLARTSFAATNDIAKTSLELSKLGFEGQSLSTVLGGVVNLSALLGDSLEATGELVGGVVTTFGLSNEEAASVADKLFVATGKSISNIEGFKVAFSLAGNAAANAGVSFEEFAAIVAALSNQGIRASTIGTGLRNFIGELSKEGSKAQQVLGGSIEEMGLLGAMNKIAELNPKTGSLIEIFGKPGAPVAAGMKKVGDEYQTFLDAVQNGNGALDDAASKFGEKLIPALQKFKNSLVELFSVSSSPLEKSLTRLTGTLSGLLNGLTEYEKAVQKVNSQSAGVFQGIEKSFIPRVVNTVLTPATTFQNIKKQMDQNSAAESYKIVDKYSTANKFSSVLAPPQKGFDPSSLLGEGKESPRVRAVLDKDKDEKARKAAERAAAKREREIEAAVQIWEKGQRHLYELREKERKDNAKADEEAVKTWEAGMKQMAEARLRDRDSMQQWAIESSAGVAYFKLSLDGLNGSIDLFSQYLAVAFTTSASNPWKGISDAFAGFARQMLAQLIALTARLILFKLALAAIGFATGGAGAVAGGGLFGFSGGGVASQLLLTSLGGVQKQASGTDQIVRKPTLFMAGEAGPERVNVTPKSSRSSARQNSGNAGFVVNVYGDINDADKFTQKVNQANERVGRNFI